MEDNVVFERPRREIRLKEAKHFVTKKTLSLVAILLICITFAVATAAAGTLAYLIIQGDVAAK